MFFVKNLKSQHLLIMCNKKYEENVMSDVEVNLERQEGDERGLFFWGGVMFFVRNLKYRQGLMKGGWKGGGNCKKWKSQNLFK
jgi:hypothetical protein